MKPIFGAHTLSSMFFINNHDKLRAVMETTVKHGGTLLEIPYLLCELNWNMVGTMAKETGIKEIALCHFWPINPDGSSVCGDPLGDEIELGKALETIGEIIKAIKKIRLSGITARFIDGPLWGGLGWDYTNLQPAEKKRRVVSFLKETGAMCATHDVLMAVEFLRPVEDKVVGSTNAMIEILAEVGFVSVGMHFDVFHSEECGEDPAQSIIDASAWIKYLHLHGSKRRAPGTTGDNCNWKRIIRAIERIHPMEETTPIVSEPFGEETCKENPSLGEGLPPALPLDEYLAQTITTFAEHGLVFDS